MKAKPVLALAFVPFIISTVLAAPPERPAGWSDYLSRSEVGADAWTRAHPTWDGRGVVIAVLDTGVDPSVPGLDTLPTGGPKLIEARDFSGEGHVVMARAERDGEVLRHGKVVARGAAALPVKPLKDNDFWLGAFDEAQLRNSQVEDVDKNGRSDDRFAVLAFRRAPDGEEVVVIDSDGDGDLADEVVRRAYGVDPQWFTFGSRGGDPKNDKAPIAFAATPLLDEKRVELHFDDGSHGSHCAGIAAGFGIEKKPGFDGIAPGARLMSLKIGHNALAGGATTSGAMAEAIRFASRWARAHQTPVVISMSYGVGSEVEGAGQIQRVLDEELQKNRWLAASLSAGNEGPGYSSVGNPAGTLLGWSAGALVPDGAWGTLFGAKQGKHKKIFAFSSRGGELDKPDGITPGVAWSTVPPYLQKAVKNGTSMAAPQAAGVMALLMSAALAEKRPWTPGLVKRALRDSAKPIAGYTSLEQGAGLVNVGAAWEALKKVGDDKGALEVAAWQVSTPVPGRPGTRAPVSYWRVGGHAPEPFERIAFKVEPRFYGDMSEATMGQHMDSFTLDSDVGWLELDRRTVGMRGSASFDILVGLDRAALNRPGIHIGRVRALRGGMTAFELPVAVVVPESFRHDWRRSFAGRLEAGDVSHLFIEVPPGATGMHAHLSVPEGYGNVYLIPFNPEGQQVEEYQHKASSLEQESGDFAAEGAALLPGTWELAVYAPLTNRAASGFELEVSFVALDAPEVLTVERGSDGVTSGVIALVNGMGEPFRGPVQAEIDAYQRAKTVTIKGERTSLPVTVAPGVSGLTVELEMDAKTWDRFTDVALNLVADGGRAVAQGAFSQRRATLEADTGAGSFTLEIVGGLVDKADEREWKVKMVERHHLAQPIAMSVESPAGAEVTTLYPGVTTELTLSAANVPGVPDGFHHRAVVTLDLRDGSPWARLVLPFERP